MRRLNRTGLAQPVLVAGTAARASQYKYSIALPYLQTILNLPAFSGAELICGRTLFNQPVTWVHIAEVLDVWRFLRSGELLLSTGLGLVRASVSVRVGYIRRLAQAGVRDLALELVQ
jgi:Purine catabolism regulatory protein-like family